MGLRDRLKDALGLGGKTHLEEGGAAPELGVADASGKVWNVNDLRGRAAVIYFYPKDDTPGCTKEACSFRDAALSSGGAALGDAIVLGVSCDAAASHRAFAQKFNLAFPLLADTSGELSKRWGVRGVMGMPRRVTFVLDREGRIARIFEPVKVDGHTEAVLAALRELP
ncbi:MAG: peroxiredoxin [Pseudomonadota bacterium]|nr:peroxiredoxin [Pseudomonadota bacterium]